MKLVIQPNSLWVSSGLGPRVKLLILISLFWVRSAPANPFLGGTGGQEGGLVGGGMGGSQPQQRQRRNINGGGDFGGGGHGAGSDGPARVNPLLGSGGLGSSKPRTKEEEEREKTAAAMSAALQRRQELTAAPLSAPFRSAIEDACWC